MKNQTAVEFIKKILDQNKLAHGMYQINDIDEIIEQAKEMESEQMQKSYTEGYEFARKELIYEIIDNYMPNERHNKV